MSHTCDKDWFDSIDLLKRKMMNNDVEQNQKYTYYGFENAKSAEALKSGNIAKLKGIGGSMTPILKSGQEVIVEPVDEKTELSKKDIVFCKVNGHYYLHLIHAIKPGDRYLIGNNHGHMNGTINRNNIFGKVVEIL